MTPWRISPALTHAQGPFVNEAMWPGARKFKHGIGTHFFNY